MAVHEQNLNQDDRYIQMHATYSGECAECEDHISTGDLIYWDTKEHKAYCLNCGEELK